MSYEDLPLFAALAQEEQTLPAQVVCDDVLAWAEKTPPIGAHAMLCDPPYELNFMGRNWDRSGIAFKADTWKALAQHLLPGAFGMCFASSRGWHRLACAIEDAGLRIHPSIFGWLTGQSFPKASRIDSQIDRNAPRVGMFEGFAKHFAGQRRTKGLSQKDIAVHFPSKTGGITGCVWNWENGANVPTLEQWRVLQPMIGLSDSFLPLIKRVETEREVIGQRTTGIGTGNGSVPIMGDGTRNLTAPATPLASIWEGHRYGGQILKNALEPIIVFQKPYSKKPVQSITQTGAGALNIKGSRVGVGEQWWERGDAPPDEATALMQGVHGRWPPNFCLSHLETCVRVGERQVDSNGHYPSSRGAGGLSTNGHAGQTNLDERTTHGETVAAWHCAPGCPVQAIDLQAGERPGDSPKRQPRHNSIGRQGYHGNTRDFETTGHSDTGGPSRFFMTADFSLDIAERLAQADPVYYCGKASRRERDSGLEHVARLVDVHNLSSNACNRCGHRVKANGSGMKCECGDDRETIKLPTTNRNPHPTIKPLKLCQWLASLLLPPADYAPRRLLIPFTGSGSEGIGAMLAGWDAMVMVDSDQNYCDIARQRMAYWQQRGRV